MKEYSWAKLKDEELLRLRIKDLGVELGGSDIENWVSEVIEELRDKGLNFLPRFYLGDEWFSPEGEAAVAIPFYLAHPRLRELEQSMMLECEGESEQEFKRILRHEIGHAFEHAFHLSRRRSRTKIFGSSKQDYDPDTYRPRPYSKNFVSNVGRWYAQSHPDEDFAETFAVWLDPGSNWENKYKNWAAIKKLNYIEKLTKECGDKTVAYPKGRMVSDARYLKSTLSRFYKRKISDSEEDYPKFFDQDLLRIFVARTRENKKNKRASQLMRQNRKAIVATISHWTRERKVTVNNLFKRLVLRCRQLDLVVHKTEKETIAELSTYLATLISNYLFTGHFKRRV